jgi:hypothetical protein
MFAVDRSPARRVVTGALLVALAIAVAGPAAAKKKNEEILLLQERVTALEAQVADMQAFLKRLGWGDDSTTDRELAELTEMVIPATVTNKRFQSKDPANGLWEDYLNLDVVYDTSELTKPVAALKGMLQFTDLFGELRFEMPATISKRIEPGDPVPQEGLRFEYNQFRPAHQWLFGTESKDMVVALRVSAVNYEDGTSREYAPPAR